MKVVRVSSTKKRWPKELFPKDFEFLCEGSSFWGSFGEGDENAVLCYSLRYDTSLLQSEMHVVGSNGRISSALMT